MRDGKIGAIGLGGIIVIGLICLLLCAERVPTGHVGVVYNMNGGVDGEVLTQGWHIVSPTKKVTTYSIGIEQSYLTAADKGDSKSDESFSTPTSDGKSLIVDLEFSYKFDENRVADTFTRFKGQSGEDVKNSFIKPKMIAWTQEVTAKYPVTDVFGDKRQELNEALDVYLKDKFHPEVLNELTLIRKRLCGIYDTLSLTLLGRNEALLSGNVGVKEDAGLGSFATAAEAALGNKTNGQICAVIGSIVELFNAQAVEVSAARL